MEWLEDNLFWVQLLLTRTFGSFAAFYAGAVRYIPVGCTVQVHGKCWPRVCLFWVWIRINYSFQAKKDHPLFAKKTQNKAPISWDLHPYWLHIAADVYHPGWRAFGFCGRSLLWCSKALDCQLRRWGEKGDLFGWYFWIPTEIVICTSFVTRNFVTLFPKTKTFTPPTKQHCFCWEPFLEGCVFFSPS